MSGFLLDTNCISEVVRIKPDPHVVDWFATIDESLLFLSVLTLGEIRKGLGVLAHGRRRTQLEAWLFNLQVRFSGRILRIDEAVADRWGLLAADARRKGRALSTVDGLLAATALQHNLSIATRNADDFSFTQVRILNPWKI